MKNYTIKAVTNVRGFIKDLFEINDEEVKFIYDTEKVYEVITNRNGLISNIIHKRIFDSFGLFKIIKCSINEDIAFSYNRLLKSNKPYILYLENPLAIVHYCMDRPYTFLSRVRLKRAFNDGNLKAIVCLSKACRDTIRNYYELPNNLPVLNIYPYVKQRLIIDKETIRERAYNPILNCLYISSDFSLKGGREIIRALESVDCNKIKLTIITKRETIPDNDLQILSMMNNIKLLDFNLSKEELAALYYDANVLLNPSRQDSFSLVVLEAMKAGNAIISSDIYAIPEMVTDGVEGYLGQVKYQFWNRERMPNKEVWNHRKKTIYSDYIDNQMVDFITDKIKTLIEDKNTLYNLQLNAYIKANSGDFNDREIIKKWKTVICRACE